MSAHEFIPHTAELALRISAASLPGVYAEACCALGELLIAEAGNRGEAQERTVSIASVDDEALLVDLLNELIYLAETARWAPRAARVVRHDAGGLSVRMGGVALRRAPSRIKSATHHGLRFDTSDAGVTAVVIFDV